jgi:hypothetical protein
MTDTTINNLVTLGAVVLGAGLGALFQLLSARWQLGHARADALRAMRRDVYFGAIDDLEHFRHSTDDLIAAFTEYAQAKAGNEASQDELERLDEAGVTAYDEVEAARRALARTRDRAAAVGSRRVVEALDRSAKAFATFLDRIDLEAGAFSASRAQAMQLTHQRARDALTAAIRTDLGIEETST